MILHVNHQKLHLIQLGPATILLLRSTNSCEVQWEMWD